MQLTLSTESPDVPKHKCLALGVFADEKPPRGLCGFIDWRLNGMISREMKQGRICGEFEEKIIIPFPRRVGAEILFLFGLGNISDINYDKIYNAAYLIAQAADGMALNNFAFDLYGEGRASLVTANIMEAMVTGIFDFLSTDIEKISKMNVCAVTSPAHLQDVSLGIKQFKTNVNDKGSVDLSAFESSFA
ncbi:MAG TPA: M17 family peptidase N-terminal domain-containing protein [Smithella sp.]|nr:M17 family peptidase N-terminal domain-containing protein [Smithella sp.]